MKKQIKQIKSVFTDEQLRQMFAKRLDDSLFIEAGTVAVGVRQAKTLSESELIWEGYESLLEVEKV